MKISNNFGPFWVKKTTQVHNDWIGINQIESNDCFEWEVYLNYVNPRTDETGSRDFVVPASELFLPWFRFLLDVMVRDNGKYQTFTMFDYNHGVRARMVGNRYEFMCPRGDLKSLDTFECIRAPLIYGLKEIKEAKEMGMLKTYDISPFIVHPYFFLNDIQFPEIQEGN